MTKITPAVIFSVLIFFLSGCTDDSDDDTSVDPQNFPQQVQFQTLEKRHTANGFTFINSSQFHEIIRTDQEWTNFKQTMDSDFVNPLQVDFSTDMVIAVFDEPKAEQYASPEILGIQEYMDEIQVSVSYDTVGTMLQAPSHPWHLITLPQSDKTIIFN